MLGYVESCSLSAHGGLPIRSDRAAAQEAIFWMQQNCYVYNVAAWMVVLCLQSTWNAAGDCTLEAGSTYRAMSR
jgi:hypothetical protein